MKNNISVDSEFDAGNIICESADRVDDIRLKIARDHQSEFMQWFYYRVTSEPGVERVMRILNAGDCAYTKGWEDYQACVSYDRKNWVRTKTHYEDGVLTIRHTPEYAIAYYAYFVPYSMEQHADLVAGVQMDNRVEVSCLGHTLDDQALDLVTVGKPSADKPSFWITARQHPGETMAEWWMEGFLERLLDRNDAVASSLLDKVVFYIVPNMNPDGSKRGHLRTNAAGVNLNREWNKSTRESSPEVFYVVEKMRQTGVDFALDVHGDEALPYAFIAGAEGVPGFSESDAALLHQYQSALVSASADFQTEFGYPKNEPDTADLRICTNFLAAEFGCLAMTLEMPFKDNANHPDPVQGWSVSQCRQLGADCLQAMSEVIETLNGNQG